MSRRELEAKPEGGVKPAFYGVLCCSVLASESRTLETRDASRSSQKEA